MITTKTIAVLALSTLFHGKAVAHNSFIIANPDTGKVLDVVGAKCAEGVSIHLWNYDGGPNQWWDLGENDIIKTTIAGCDMAIELVGDCTEEAAIQLSPADPTKLSQQFILKTRLGEGTIRSKKCEGFALTVNHDETSAGTLIKSSAIDSKPDQKFKQLYRPEYSSGSFQIINEATSKAVHTAVNECNDFGSNLLAKFIGAANDNQLFKWGPNGQLLHAKCDVPIATEICEDGQGLRTSSTASGTLTQWFVDGQNHLVCGCDFKKVLGFSEKIENALELKAPDGFIDQVWKVKEALPDAATYVFNAVTGDAFDFESCEEGAALTLKKFGTKISQKVKFWDNGMMTVPKCGNMIVNEEKDESTGAFKFSLKKLDLDKYVNTLDDLDEKVSDIIQDNVDKVTDLIEKAPFTVDTKIEDPVIINEMIEKHEQAIKNLLGQYSKWSFTKSGMLQVSTEGLRDKTETLGMTTKGGDFELTNKATGLKESFIEFHVPFTPDKHFRIVNPATGKALYVTDCEPGSNIKAKARGEINEHQLFNFAKDGTIRSVMCPLGAVNLDKNACKNGANINLMKAGESDGQSWGLDGNGRIHAGCSHEMVMRLSGENIDIGPHDPNADDTEWVIEEDVSSAHFYIVNPLTSKALTAPDACQEGASLEVYDWDGSSSQRFRRGPGMKIYSVHCPKQAIDLTDGICENGNTIKLSSSSAGSCSQQWHLGLDLGFRSICCMEKEVMQIDESNLANGAQVHIYDPQGGLNQQWAFYHVPQDSLFRILNPQTGKVIAPAKDGCENIILGTKDAHDDTQLFRFNVNGEIVNDKCGTHLDLGSSSCEPGTNVMLSQGTKQASQRFGFDSSGRISPNCPAPKGRLHLTIAEGSASDGTNIELGLASGSWEQEFIVEKISTPPILPQVKKNPLERQIFLKPERVDGAEGFSWSKIQGVVDGVIEAMDAAEEAAAQEEAEQATADDARANGCSSADQCNAGYDTELVCSSGTCSVQCGVLDAIYQATQSVSNMESSVASTLTAETELGSFKIPTNDGDVSFIDFILDEISGASGAGVLIPQVILAGSDEDITDLGGDVGACETLDYLGSSDILGFGFEYGGMGLCVGINPCSHTYAIAQDGILPEVTLARIINLSLTSVGFSYNKDLSSETLTELWDGTVSGGKEVVENKEMDGHFVITGAANIGIDAGNAVTMVIEATAKLLVDADLNNNGIMPPMAKNAADFVSNLDFAVLLSGSAAAKLEIAGEEMDLSGLTQVDADLMVTINGADTELLLGVTRSMSLQGICDLNEWFGVFCAIFDGSATQVSASVKAFVKPDGNSVAAGVMLSFYAALELTDTAEDILDIIGVSWGGGAVDVQFSVAVAGDGEVDICFSRNGGSRWCIPFCDGDHDRCGSDSFCNLLNVCEKQKGLGGACTGIGSPACSGSNTCVAGFCCECAAIDTQSTCEDDEFCTQPFGIGYVCEEKRDNGGLCLDKIACKSDYCLLGVCASKAVQEAIDNTVDDVVDVAEDVGNAVVDTAKKLCFWC